MPPWKRGLDLFLILLLSPGWMLVGGLVALVIKLGSRGPLLFKQKRVGYKGQEFTCLKFRTMQTNADTAAHQRYTQQLIKSKDPMQKLDVRKDPRVIPLGRLIRAGGLDELPQLLNVLRGEMTLVGPRPCIRYECDLYEPWHWQRFDAVPGLTGLWQVSGKNRTTFEQMVRLDIEYAREKSFWLDLKIIVLTVPTLFSQYLDLRAARRPASPVSAPRISKTAQTV